jgi:nitroreductase
LARFDWAVAVPVIMPTTKTVPANIANVRIFNFIISSTSLEKTYSNIDFDERCITQLNQPLSLKIWCSLPMSKNPVDYPIFESMTARWSPYRFEPRVVEDEKLLMCLEAARWAASSYNDQPWSWIVARHQDSEAFQVMVGCLLEANQVWASRAGVLMIGVIRTTFRQNQKPNRVALHDLGAAAAHIALQATKLDLQVHQMAGLNLSRTRQVYGIPDGYEPQTAIAIGYPDSSKPETELDQKLHERESGPRTRRPLGEQTFEGKWGQTAGFLS